MANERWTYQVIEVKNGFWGVKRDAMQERLNQLGLQGWELVSVLQTNQLHPTHLYLKKSL